MSRPTPSEQDQGVAFGPGCQPSASAPSGSSQSGIPNAGDWPGWPFWEIVEGEAERLFADLGNVSVGNALRRGGVRPDKLQQTLDYVRSYYETLAVELVARLLRAQAIEARSAAAAKTDAVEDESAVPKGCAQP